MVIRNEMLPENVNSLSRKIKANKLQWRNQN